MTTEETICERDEFSVWSERQGVIDGESKDSDCDKVLYA